MKKCAALMIPLVVMITILTAAFVLTLRVHQSSIDIYAQEQIRLKVDNIVSILSSYILNLYHRQTEAIIRWYDWNAMILNLSTPYKKGELFEHVHRAVVWGLPKEDYEAVLNVTTNVSFLIPPPYLEGIIPLMRKTLQEVQQISNVYVEIQIYLYNYTSNKTIPISISSKVLETLDPAEIMVFPLDETEIDKIPYGPGPGWYTRFNYPHPYAKDVEYLKDTFYVCYPRTVITVRAIGGGITYERKYVVAERCIPYDIGIYKQAETE